MVRIVLSDEQRRLLDSPEQEIPVYGRDGAYLGVLQRQNASDARIQEAIRRMQSGEQGVTTAELLERLSASSE
jgi:hypothetical protein